jgi:uncharacterized protein (DUF4415 family)
VEIEFDPDKDRINQMKQFAAISAPARAPLASRSPWSAPSAYERRSDANGDAMRKPSEKPSNILQEDWDAVDVPEATAEDFARARPFKEVFPEQYKAWKRMGRPPVESPKVHISFRLASDVVDGIRATGQGYNARVEKVLRDALKRGELNSQRNLPSAAVIPERISEMRAQLQEQIDELEITERVLGRFEQAKTAERQQGLRRRRVGSAAPKAQGSLSSERFRR